MSFSTAADYSEITVDLSQVESLRALASLCTTKSKKARVKNITAHVQLSMWQENEDFEDGLPILSADSMLGVFSLIASFPNLKYLTVDLQDRTLPLPALLMVLGGAKRLKELHLRDLTIPGERGQGLQAVLKTNRNLERVKLFQVKGTSAVQALMTNLPNLRSLEVVGTKISTMGNLTSTVLISACQSPSLRRIRLQDIPDLDDEHISTLCIALRTYRQKMSLQEFHLSSVSLGEKTGSALTALLLATSFLQEVTIDLGYWSKCGSSIAEVLTHNTTLTSLKVLLTGRHQNSVNLKAIEVFAALKGNRTLKALRLAMNNSTAAAGPKVEQSVLEALEEALVTNHTLGKLTIVDDCRGPLPLPYSATSKLEQNRAGLSPLLYHPSDNFHAQYATAIFQNKDNLDLVFFALINNPIVLASAGDASPEYAFVADASSEDTNPFVEERAEAISVSTATTSRKKLLSPKSIQRGVRRLRGRWSRNT